MARGTLTVGVRVGENRKEPLGMQTTKMQTFMAPETFVNEPIAKAPY